ncbi:MAG: hypothetical protein V3U45_00005, partial [bacterium]
MGLLVLCLLLTALAIPSLADEAPGLGVAAGVERQESTSRCLAIGNNWTACDNAFASDDAYADANASVSEGIIAYRSNTGACGGSPLNCPKSRTWEGTTSGSEVELSAAGSAVRGTRVVWDRKSDSTEHWIVAYEDDGTLDVYFCSAPGSCSLNLTDAGDLWAAAPGDHSKSYDIAYEATSRDLLLVYEVDVADATRDLAYRTFSRSTLTWSTEQYLDHASVVSTNPVVAWVELAVSVDAGTNNVGLLFFDASNDDALLATWDGTGWRTGAHQTACSMTVTRADSMGGTIAAEGLSGDYLALCGNGEDSAAYRTWTEASGWSAATIFDPNPVAANDLRWLSSHPRPNSDEIMVLYSDDLRDILASRWSGSALGGWSTLATDSQAGKRRPMGFAWNPDQSTTGDGLLVYDINVAGSAAYRTWDNGLPSWTAQATFSASGTHRWVEVVGNPNNETLKAKVFLLDDGAFDILAYNWKGSGAPTAQFTISPDTTTRNFEMWESAWGPALPGKNDTAWFDFGLDLGPQDTVSRFEVGVEWHRLNVRSILNVTVSWDGGSTWAPNQTAMNKSAADDMVEYLDFTSATAWDPVGLNNANLRVRVGTNHSGARLDYLTVRVNYNAVPVISPVLRLDRMEAERGDVVLAILYYNNTGSGGALRAWANWSLDGHYELMDIFPAQTTTFSAEGFDIWLTDVDPGAHSLVARLRVIRGLEDGLAMEVRITWEVTDGNGNPLPGAGDAQVVALLAPILTVDLRASDTSVQVGSEFILEVTVENTGRADGSGWLNMTLPPGAAFVSQDGTLEITTSAGLVSWRIASLAPAEQIHIQVRLRVNEGPSLESFVFAVDFTDGEGSPPLTVFSNQV